MITVEEAEEKISRELKPLPIKEIPFVNATGYILRESITADRPIPPYDRVMMDGIALSSEGWTAGHRSFVVAGLQLAGIPALALDKPKHCIKVMTGAVMPKGCDIVVPCEEIEEESHIVHVNADFEAVPLRWLHRCGSDCDTGSELVSPGTELGSREIAVAASCGREFLPVTREVQLSVIDTGDELVEVGELVDPYQIRRSNAHAITTACDKMPYVKAISSHCPDNEDMLRNKVGEALLSHDIVLLCGGVSKGDRDYVPTILAEHGIEEVFHWVSQRPGKPLWFGRLPHGPLVFGLPGNPLSVLTCFHRYVKTALRGLAGAKPIRDFRVALTESISHPPPTTMFLPVTLRSGEGAVLEAVPCAPRNSGDFAAIVGTDGFVQLPAEQEKYPAGFVATFFPW